jgi:hypothetical protein
MSIKDRSVGPHEQVLNIPIAYWCYGPGKPSSWSPSGAWLTPLASLTGSGEKLGTNPRDQSAGVLWIVSGALFLRSSGICPNLLAVHERLPRTGTAHRKRTPDVRGLVWEAYVSYWSSFPLQGVHRFESP